MYNIIINNKGVNEMAVGVRLGNLGIEELERALGIVFTEEDRNLLKETRQEQVMEGNKVLKMPSRAWHFFDMPRVLELGSYAFYLEIEKLLLNYEIKGRLEVSFVFADDEKIENLYELESENSYPNYLFGHIVSGKFSEIGSFSFWQIYKENKKTIEYRRVKYESFFEEKKELKRYVRNDFLVPCEDGFYNVDYQESVRFKKEELENPQSEMIKFNNYGYIVELKPWKGERVPALGSSKKVDWEEYKEKEKAYRKRVRNLGK